MIANFIPEKLKFSFYTDDEIMNISVLEITEPSGCDAFGHPYDNGLYDQRLGPLDPNCSCKTCGLSYYNCPGHFGHIMLAKRVFNPLVFQTLLSLLKATCFSCRRLIVSEKEKIIECLKFFMLRKDLSISEVDMLTEIKDEESFNKRVAEMFSKTTVREEKFSCYLVQDLLAHVLSVASRRKCFRCHKANPKLSCSGDLKIMKMLTSDEAINKYEYFSPEDVYEIMGDMFKNENVFMRAVFDAETCDFLFLKNLIVTPAKFRPPSFTNGKIFEHLENLHLKKIMKINDELKNDDSYWPELQAYILFYFDNSKGPNRSDNPPGKKQVLEKKEGLFRRNILGKRVNFAARSVISPDPNVETREIGVPLIFAEKLTFPEKVTEYNYDRLRKAVINGNNYPGATTVQVGDQLQSLSMLSEEKRKVIANQLLDKDKIVWRHMQTGDIVLVNRQPTLHKPSIMGHKVRVLQGEKTLRMHYVNCKPYNADFDGDEMNVHFPQSEMARAEAEFLSMNDFNYLVPTNGEPIRGLTQDHLVVAAILTLKDTFLSKEIYVDLVGSGLPNRRLKLEKPCISKPIALYSGKQVVTTILKNLNISISHTKSTKISETSWKDHKEESTAVFYKGTMVTGILDKSIVGPTSSSLIHACGEIFGFNLSNDLLTYISKIVNRYILLFGFTVRMDDLVLDKDADIKRKEFIVSGNSAASLEQSKFFESDPIYYYNQSKIAYLDSVIRKYMNTVTTKIVDVTIPDGLLRKFPSNSMTLMVITGAKGSSVNLSQIMGLLGQQELEGKRVSLMNGGRTLPCFLPLEPSPTSGGFVFQRFLSGINPAEYFFHCMAGREGLIDTAVKTSSSGYLQRSLIKHLEGIRVDYDMSVRNGDKIIQFLYGEDGLDCTKAVYLNDVEFYLTNHELISEFCKKYQRMLDGSTIDRIFVNEKFNSKLSEVGSDAADIMRTSYLKALVDPGEPVGILAGQSVGEPSTQMTLNTFHLAGVGAKNVTLGIPRLREILMVASKDIKTPLTTIPFLREPPSNFVSLFNQVTLYDCIDDLRVDENLVLCGGVYRKEVRITVKILKYESEAMACLDKKFLEVLGRRISRTSSTKRINIKEVETAEDDIAEVVKEVKDDMKDDDSSCEDSSVEEEYPIGVEEETKNEETKNDDEQECEGDFELAKISKLSNFRKIGDNTYLYKAYFPSSFNCIILPIIESILPKLIVHEHPHVKGASIQNNALLAESSNIYTFTDFVKLDGQDYDLLEILDLTQSVTNDIYAISNTLGIEAARETLINEVINVFDAYGIDIDIRHLMLIADYMTHTGEYTAFNRHAMNISNSPLQKMSFESSFSNIKNSCQFRDVDNLTNPSARMCVGLPVDVGTSVFDLIYDFNNYTC